MFLNRVSNSTSLPYVLAGVSLLSNLWHTYWTRRHSVPLAPEPFIFGGRHAFILEGDTVTITPSMWGQCNSDPKCEVHTKTYTQTHTHTHTHIYSDQKRDDCPNCFSGPSILFLYEWVCVGVCVCVCVFVCVCSCVLHLDHSTQKWRTRVTVQLLSWFWYFSINGEPWEGVTVKDHHPWSEHFLIIRVVYKFVQTLLNFRFQFWIRTTCSYISNSMKHIKSEWYWNGFKGKTYMIGSLRFPTCVVKKCSICKNSNQNLAFQASETLMFEWHMSHDIFCTFVLSWSFLVVLSWCV